MEKYGVADEDMITGLRDEEHSLMLRMSQHMLMQEKTAADTNDLHMTESRLQAIRAKITEHDLKKMQKDG